MVARHAYVCFSDYSSLVLLSLLYKLRHIILCGWGVCQYLSADDLILKLLASAVVAVSLNHSDYNKLFT